MQGPLMIDSSKRLDSDYVITIRPVLLCVYPYIRSVHTYINLPVTEEGMSNGMIVSTVVQSNRYYIVLLCCDFSIQRRGEICTLLPRRK